LLSLHFIFSPIRSAPMLSHEIYSSLRLVTQHGSTRWQTGNLSTAVYRTIKLLPLCQEYVS
jgi:hypothetical protein